MQTSHLYAGRLTPSVLQRSAALVLICCLIASPVQAAFHLWTVREIYSDVSGDLQFIELFTSDNFQEFVGGQTISVRNVGNTMTHSFTLPNNVPGGTANHALLLATSGIDAAGGPTPDFTLPSDFLFPAGGTITFFGTPAQVAYAALPIDGLRSRNADGSDNLMNSPINFAGQSGLVMVPEPSTFTLLGLGAISLLCAFRRRRI